MTSSRRKTPTKPRRIDRAVGGGAGGAAERENKVGSKKRVWHFVFLKTRWWSGIASLLSRLFLFFVFPVLGGTFLRSCVCVCVLVFSSIGPRLHNAPTIHTRA